MTFLISNHSTSRNFNFLNLGFLQKKKMNSSDCKVNTTASLLNKQALKPSEPSHFFSSTPSLITDKENDKLQNLQLTYKKIKKIFADVEKIQTHILRFSEYWSLNKNNITHESIKKT